MNKKLISRILSCISITLLATAFILILVHLYLGDRHFDTGKNFFPPESQFIQTDNPDFNFAIMSDSGNNNLVLEKIIRHARRSDQKYAFFLYLGDLVMNRHETYFYWMLSEILPKLHHKPFYMVPGNHDVIHDGDTDKSFYRSVMGATYYWFGYGNTLFIGLDSSAEYMENEQFLWLENILTKISPHFKHCIIFSHRPPQIIPGYRDHKMDDKSIERLRAIVKKHHKKIDAMFFGHVHYFSEQKFEGVPIYTAPTAGQGSSVDKRFGYIGVQVTDKGGVNVTPVFIEPPEYRREYFELFWAAQILTPKLRGIVTVLLILSALSAAGYYATKPSCGKPSRD